MWYIFWALTHTSSNKTSHHVSSPHLSSFSNLIDFLSLFILCWEDRTGPEREPCWPVWCSGITDVCQGQSYISKDCRLCKKNLFRHVGQRGWVGWRVSQFNLPFFSEQRVTFNRFWEQPCTVGVVVPDSVTDLFSGPLLCAVLLCAWADPGQGGLWGETDCTSG